MERGVSILSLSWCHIDSRKYNIYYTTIGVVYKDGNRMLVCLRVFMQLKIKKKQTKRRMATSLAWVVFLPCTLQL